MELIKLISGSSARNMIQLGNAFFFFFFFFWIFFLDKKRGGGGFRNRFKIFSTQNLLLAGWPVTNYQSTLHGHWVLSNNSWNVTEFSDLAPTKKMVVFEVWTPKNTSWIYLPATVLGHGKHGSHLSTNQCRCIDHVDRYIADSLASFNCFFHTLLG